MTFGIEVSPISGLQRRIMRDDTNFDERFYLLRLLTKGNEFSKYVVNKAILALRRCPEVESLEDLQKMYETGEINTHFRTDYCPAFRLGEQTRKCLRTFVQRFEELSASTK